MTLPNGSSQWKCTLCGRINSQVLDRCTSKSCRMSKRLFGVDINPEAEAIKANLAAGAEVDARTPKGATIFMTPLMWATYGGHLDQCRLLLEAGADPTAVDENGKSVLEMSREARHADVEALLVEAIERRSTENEKYVA